MDSVGALTARDGKKFEALTTRWKSTVIFSGVCSASLFNNVHLLPNTVARLIVRKRKSDSITAALRDNLHWLPDPHRMHHKLYLLVYRCSHRMTPSYLSVMCVPVSTDPACRSLRSAISNDLLILRTRTTGCGPRSFAVSGPSCWNCLPLPLKSPSLSIQESPAVADKPARRLRKVCTVYVRAVGL